MGSSTIVTFHLQFRQFIPLATKIFLQEQEKEETEPTEPSPDPSSPPQAAVLTQGPSCSIWRPGLTTSMELKAT